MFAFVEYKYVKFRLVWLITSGGKYDLDVHPTPNILWNVKMAGELVINQLLCQWDLLVKP